MNGTRNSSKVSCARLPEIAENLLHHMAQQLIPVIHHTPPASLPRS